MRKVVVWPDRGASSQVLAQAGPMLLLGSFCKVNVAATAPKSCTRWIARVADETMGQECRDDLHSTP